MTENAPRSVCLVILMIAAIALPLMHTAEPPPELEKEPPILEVPPDPCATSATNPNGYDACLGLDAAGSMNANTMCPGSSTPGSCPIADLTNYVDYGSTHTTTTFYGNLTYGVTSSPTYDDDDVYKFTIPWGYGVDVSVEWNGTHDMLDAWMGTSCGTSQYNCNNLGSDGRGGHGAYMSSQGNDVSGQDVYVWLDCYSSYCNAATYANDYMLNITTWPADNGVPGDWNRGPTLLELYDGCTFGPPNQNCDGSYTYWSQKTGTFTVSLSLIHI